MEYSSQVKDLVRNAEKKLNFEEIEEIAVFNQNKVLDAFRDNQLSARHFAPTNGYGYDDIGRDTLNKVFAQVFKAESAIVTPYIASGTHALSLMLNSVCKPGDKLTSISGSPYETLNQVITGEGIGSLKDYGVSYSQIDLINGEFDTEKIKAEMSDTNVVFITRSRGYEWRDAQSLDSIAEIIKVIKSINKDIIIAIDNCYGEFIEKYEPLEIGADIIAGSLIKNAGGGLAPSGGYIAGRKDLVERVAYRMIAPGVGLEVSSYAYGYQLFYQGLFMAPTTVLNAIKGSLLFGQVYADLGLETMPKPEAKCNDIIRSILFDTKEELIDFCRSIQEISPIDSHLTLEPWAMPGYESDVIMAAGTFVGGASIELSADSPIRAPYIAYVQGGLTYEHAKLAVLYSLQRYLNNKNK